MYSIPPGFTSPCLPLGEFLIYSTNRPSIRTLVHQTGDLGYSIEVYLFPNNDLRTLPPGAWHWAEVIGDAILVIVPPSLSALPVEQSNVGSSGSTSDSSHISSIGDPDQVDPDYLWLGKGS